jgi:hypothetical protein
MRDEPMTKDAGRWGPLTGALFVARRLSDLKLLGINAN